MTTEKALEYIEKYDKKISRTTYFRKLGELKTKHNERIWDIAKNSSERHIERSDTLETITSLMWDEFEAETDHLKRTKILKEIRDMLIYQSAFDQGTQDIAESVIKDFDYGSEGEQDIQSGMSSLFTEKKRRRSKKKTS